MNSRISDPRIAAALTTGVIAGFTTHTITEIALVADLLLAQATWADMHFMFDGLARHGGPTFLVPVPGRGEMLFEWMDELGPINLRLIE